MNPTEAAHELGVSAATLRRWSQSFEPLLSADAAQPATGTARHYTTQDIALLRQAKRLLAERLTSAQVLNRLSAHAPERSPQAPVDEDAPSHRTDYVTSSVVVLDQAPEVAALHQLLDAQRETVAALRETLEAQQAIVGAQSQVIDAQRSQLDVLERGLQQARADEAAALADLRLVIARIPRWLRSWLRLGL